MFGRNVRIRCRVFERGGQKYGNRIRMSDSPALQLQPAGQRNGKQVPPDQARSNRIRRSLLFQTGPDLSRGLSREGIFHRWLLSEIFAPRAAQAINMTVRTELNSACFIVYIRDTHSLRYNRGSVWISGTHGAFFIEFMCIRSRDINSD